ncbi:7-cyano-7-deazaguanine synthase [Abditibacterium utsteinense]|uniref:7-cyano-7-deazaguanine synthase n=1 Tax=Abditibacterium utsteinense TaxID=1960156 RepID=A0A2S8SSM7_9BACT|nr:7-cyano-7-deazaguanine synthase QueC [Abditibacterium utsteinense]PQV63778.1 7-cyano-7-deazaguanine synthase [Abditibacterium utsteinense]
MKKAIAIVSGGLDSVTLAHLLAAQGYELQILSFNYGQKHLKELDFARDCANRLNARFNIVDLTSLTPLIGGNALTDASVAVPHGHYAQENMSVTVVPNRNAIFLSLAYGAAVAQNAQVVGFGVHSGDHFIYPDCRPAFVEAFELMQKKAIEGFGDADLKLYTPFLKTDKSGIVTQGAKIGVPFERTWSCYEGGALHCGQCGTCVERKEAFIKAGVKDPTSYAA